jgi:hypothetical protein
MADRPSIQRFRKLISDRKFPVSHHESTELTTSLEARAERVLAEYLRGWGLRDPSTIAHLCRRWVQQASEGAAAADDPPAIQRAAVRIAISEIDRRLDQIEAATASHGGQSGSRRGLLAIELQALIDRYPALLLPDEPLPAAIVEQLRRAGRPVVPPSLPSRMPEQPLGELAPALRWNWWARSAGRLLAGTAGALRFRRSKRVEA